MENQKDKTVIWQSVLDIIEQNTTQISFETWFKPLRIRKIDTDLNIVYLELKSDKGKDFIIDTIKKRHAISAERLQDGDGRGFSRGAQGFR